MEHMCVEKATKMIIYNMLLLLLFACQQTWTLTSIGRTFLMVCPESKLAEPATDFKLIVNFPYTNADVSITAPLLSTTVTTLVGILQGSTRESPLGLTYMINGTGVSNKVLLVNATADVSVYMISPDGDGYMGIPIESLGIDYYIVTYCEGTHPCQFSVTAAEDNTQVEIILSISNTSESVVLDGTNYVHGDVISVTLTQYETLQIQCSSDLTGTYVVSNKPVVVVGGGAGSTVAGGEVSGFLIEQFPPVTTYGTEFLTIPSKYIETVGDYYRIVTSQLYTTIQIGNGGRRTFPKIGDWLQIRMTGTQVISSDKPILVVRLTQSSKSTSTTERPSMMVLVPTEQFLSGTLKIVLPKSPNSWIILVARDPVTSAILVNYNPQNSGWMSVPGSNLFIKYVLGSATTVQYILKDVSRAFTVYYQVDTSTYSASYIGAMNFDVTNPSCQSSTTGIGDTVDNDCDGLIDEDVCPFDGPPLAYVGKDCQEIVFGERDSFGRRFVMAFPQNKLLGNYSSLIFSTHSSSPVTVNVRTPGNLNILDEALVINTNHVYNIPSIVEVVGTTLSDMGIQVQASEEISIYSLSNTPSPRKSGGASRLLPVEVLGKEYYAVTVCEVGMCQITIVAAHPQTLVRVRVNLGNTSGQIVYKGKPYLHGDVIMESLLQYQVWQLQCDVDMTGTRITSDKPVSVFSGSVYSTYIIIQQEDHMVEQLLPVVTWGFTSAVVQTPARLDAACWFAPKPCDDVIRVIASDSNTTVQVYNGMKNGDVMTFNLNFTGAWAEFTLNRTAYIESNKAVSVMQLLTDGSSYSAGILAVLPVMQYRIGDIIKIVPDSDYKYELIIVTKSTYRANILSNMTYLTSAVDFDIGMVYFRETMGAGNSVRIQTDNASITIGGYLYARIPSASYIFPLASYHKQINQPCVISLMAVGDGIDNDCDGTFDEEPCNSSTPIDFDFDGMFDEDCAEPTEISSSSSISPSTILSSTIDSSNAPNIDSTSSYMSETSVTSPVDSTSVGSSNTYSISGAITSNNIDTIVSTDVLLTPSSEYAFTSGDAVCNCGCITWSVITFLEPESLAEVTESIKSELIVDAKEVSKTTRKYISVPDPRVSAQTVGYFGVAVISGIFIGIFILDSAALFKDITNLVKTVKQFSQKT